MSTKHILFTYSPPSISPIACIGRRFFLCKALGSGTTKQLSCFSALWPDIVNKVVVKILVSDNLGKLARKLYGARLATLLCNLIHVFAIKLDKLFCSFVFSILSFMIKVAKWREKWKMFTWILPYERQLKIKDEVACLRLQKACQETSWSIAW